MAFAPVFYVLLLALGANIAGAHHSTAVFTMDKVVELRGVVVDFKLRSPHSSFVVDARHVRRRSARRER